MSTRGEAVVSICNCCMRGRGGVYFANSSGSNTQTTDTQCRQTDRHLDCSFKEAKLECARAAASNAASTYNKATIHLRLRVGVIGDAGKVEVYNYGGKK